MFVFWRNIVTTYLNKSLAPRLDVHPPPVTPLPQLREIKATDSFQHGDLRETSRKMDDFLWSSEIQISCICSVYAASAVCMLHLNLLSFSVFERKLMSNEHEDKQRKPKVKKRYWTLDWFRHEQYYQRKQLCPSWIQTPSCKTCCKKLVSISQQK